MYDMICFLCMLEGLRLVLPVHNGRYHHVMTIYMYVHGTDSGKMATINSDMHSESEPARGVGNQARNDRPR